DRGAQAHTDEVTGPHRRLQAVAGRAGSLSALITHAPDPSDRSVTQIAPGPTACARWDRGRVPDVLARRPAAAVQWLFCRSDSATATQWPRSSHSWRFGDSVPIVVEPPWPVSTTVRSGSSKSVSVIDWMIVSKLEYDRPVAPGPPWNRVSPENRTGLDAEAPSGSTSAGILSDSLT